MEVYDEDIIQVILIMDVIGGFEGSGGVVLDGSKSRSLS